MEGATRNPATVLMASLARRVAAEALAPPSCSRPSSARGSWREAVGRQRGARAARQHAADRRHPVVLILVFGPLSGAHFNPAVILRVRVCAASCRGAMRRPLCRLPGHRRCCRCPCRPRHVRAAAAGSSPPRRAPGSGQWLAEAVATFGLRVDDPRMLRRAPPAQCLTRSASTSPRPTGSPPRPPSPIRL